MVAPEADLHSPFCPSREVLDHVTSRWAPLVLISLREGTLRFSELRRRVGGVSEKMLAQTLRTLERDGFVSRTVFPEVPPRVEYALSPMGEELAERVDALGGWITANLERVLAARAEATATGGVSGSGGHG